MDQVKEMLVATVTTLVLPAICASLVVMFAVRLVGGQRVGPLATMLAVVAALLVGAVFVDNSLSEEFPWRLERDRPLKEDDLRQVFAWSLEEKPAPKPPEDGAEAAGNLPEEDPPPINRLPIYWLPYLAVLAMVVEILLPLLAVPAGPGWAVRTGVALLAGRLLCRSDVRIEHPWISWALGLAILLEWALLTGLARRWLDGVVATGLGVCCVTACMVLALIASYATAYNLALLFGAALAGPALVAWKWPSDTSPAIAATALALPSLLLLGHSSLVEAPPYESFLLAALAPLALVPFWLPFLARRERWARWLPGLGLPIIPAAIAVIWALQASKPVPG